MSGKGVNALSTMDRREMNGRRMALVVLLAAVLLLGVVSATADAASASSPNCIEGTGAPLPPTLTAAGAASCHISTAPTLANEPAPVIPEAGARPVVQPLPGTSAAGLSTGLAPLVQPQVSRESMYWYSLYETKTEPKENCWQAGEPKESSLACDSVGASYLPNGPHMVEGAVGTDFQIKKSGDYCNYYNIGEGLDTTNENKQSGYTGYEPRSPLGAYQEGDHYNPPNVCQAYETFWGHVLQGSGNSKCESVPPCGMQHYVSLGEQGGNDRPWSSAFGEPSLVISADVLPYTQSVGVGAWGYLCPLFEDQESHDILEYCLAQWKTGSGFPAIAHYDVVAACASPGNPSHNLDQTITQFASGTQFAENIGSETTFTFGSNGTWRDFEARITEANLRAAIKMDNEPFKGSSGHPEAGYGCGRASSSEPKNWALIGIEQGIEGGGLSELGTSEANLQLYTEYTRLPPTVTTEATAGAGPFGVSLHGKVNPDGIATNYYFEYGETTSYGKDLPVGGAGVGSGTEPVTVANTLANLNPGTIYHYRIVAGNADGETTYGEDKTFTTTVLPSGSGVEYKPGEGPAHGETLVNYVNTGSSNSVWYWRNAPAGSWEDIKLGGAVAAGSSPVVEYKEDGQTLVYYVSKSTNKIAYWLNYAENGSWKWANGELGGEEVAANTSLTVEYVPGEGAASGETFVYYVNKANNSVWYWRNVPAGSWEDIKLGGTVAASSTPVAEYKTNGQSLVYYVNKPTSKIAYWLHFTENGSWKWANGELGGEAVAANTSPTVEYKPTGEGAADGETLVYYVNKANNSVWYWRNAPAGSWEDIKLGGTVAASSTPVAEYKTNGQSLVYYVNKSTSKIAFWLNYVENGSWKWANGELGGEEVAANTSPAVEYKPTGEGAADGETFVYYVNRENGAIWNWWNNTAGSWHNGAL